MSDDTQSAARTLVIGDKLRALKLVKTMQIGDQIEASIYALPDDPNHEVITYTVRPSVHTVAKVLASGHQTTVGFLKGKGTLSVRLEDGHTNTYYFDQEGRNKEITVLPGQTFYWTATNDSTLEYYELTDALVPRPAAQAPLPHPAPMPQPAKKLFLASAAVSEAQAAELIKLAGKTPAATSLLLIENAADLEPKLPDWVLQTRSMLAKHGYRPELVDLRQFVHQPVELLQKLQRHDMVWVGGGNTFYLRSLLHASRADEMMLHLVTAGKLVYAGSSAGAIVAGPTLKHFDAVENVAKLPNAQWDGVGLTNVVVIPHSDNPQYQSDMTGINQQLLRDGYKTVPLTDTQVLIITGDTQRVL